MEHQIETTNKSLLFKIDLPAQKLEQTSSGGSSPSTTSTSSTSPRNKEQRTKKQPVNTLLSPPTTKRMKYNQSNSDAENSAFDLNEKQTFSNQSFTTLNKIPIGAYREMAYNNNYSNQYSNYSNAVNTNQLIITIHMARIIIHNNY